MGDEGCQGRRRFDDMGLLESCHRPGWSMWLGTVRRVDVKYERVWCGQSGQSRPPVSSHPAGHADFSGPPRAGKGSGRSRFCRLSHQAGPGRPAVSLSRHRHGRKCRDRKWPQPTSRRFINKTATGHEVYFERSGGQKTVTCADRRR